MMYKQRMPKKGNTTCEHCNNKFRKGSMVWFAYGNQHKAYYHPKCLKEMTSNLRIGRLMSLFRNRIGGTRCGICRLGIKSSQIDYHFSRIGSVHVTCLQDWVKGKGPCYLCLNTIKHTKENKITGNSPPWTTFPGKGKHPVEYNFCRGCRLKGIFKVSHRDSWYQIKCRRTPKKS